MAKKHTSEAFYALDDPLEAAVFSVLVEVMKEIKELEERKMPSALEPTSTGPAER
jgi:hypothetical protein